MIQPDLEIQSIEDVVFLCWSNPKLSSKKLDLRRHKKTTSEEVVFIQLFLEWKCIFHDTFNHTAVLLHQTGIIVI